MHILELCIFKILIISGQPFQYNLNFGSNERLHFSAQLSHQSDFFFWLHVNVTIEIYSEAKSKTDWTRQQEVFINQ